MKLEELFGTFAAMGACCEERVKNILSGKTPGQATPKLFLVTAR